MKPSLDFHLTVSTCDCEATYRSLVWTIGDTHAICGACNTVRVATRTGGGRRVYEVLSLERYLKDFAGAVNPRFGGLA